MRYVTRLLGLVTESGLGPEAWGKTGGPFSEKLFGDLLLHESLLPTPREYRVR